MSETNKILSKRPALPFSPIIAVLGLLLPFAPALGEGIPTYGLQMCDNAGIPEDECTLAGGPWPEAEIAKETESRGKGSKAETHDAHATLRCEQLGVAPKDCVAAPPWKRLQAEESEPASAFVTAPERLPRLTATPLPEPVRGPAVESPSRVIIASPPRPVQRRTVRFVPPPPALQPPFRDVGPPPAQPVFRDVRGPLPADDASVRAFREPRVPAEPVFREGRRSTVVEEEVGFFERFFDGRNRCRREVRYSRPPSYRYVECF